MTAVTAKKQTYALGWSDSDPSHVFLLLHWGWSLLPCYLTLVEDKCFHKA